MAENTTHFWVKTNREMLASVKEVGAMPFVLFQYYLTWSTAPDGIKPSLQRIADDLDLEKTAVCNLRRRLIKAGWIKFENDEIFILKSFTKNESDSQKMNENEKNHSQKMNKHSQIVNDDSQKMNESFTKNESHIRNSKSIQKEQEKEQGEKNNGVVAGVTIPEIENPKTPPENFQSFAQNELVKSTESVVKFPLEIQTVERIVEVVPVSLKTEWLELVKNRMVNNEKAHPNYLKTRIGYWIGDFQRDYRRDIAALKANPPEPEKPKIRTQEEKQRDFDKQHYSNRKMPVIQIRVNQ